MFFRFSQRKAVSPSSVFTHLTAKEQALCKKTKTTLLVFTVIIVPFYTPFVNLFEPPF